MKKALLGVAAAIALVAIPLAAQASIFQFNATLNQGNEVGAIANVSSATGVATLSYNDFGTLSLADDKYNFSMAVFGLNAPASGFHIHGAATTTENAPVRVFLDTSPFVSLVSGGTLLVGGNAVTAPVSIPATPISGVNAGHPSMSFLAILQGGLAYVNVHTPLALGGNPGGEVRGQLVQVAVVPEPETFAMLLAGLGLVGWASARRRNKAA